MFAILLDTPATSKIEVRSLPLAPGAQVRLLGFEGELEWSQSGEHAVIQLPADLPAAPAHTLRITPPPA